MDKLLKGIYNVVKDQHFSKIKSLSTKLKSTRKDDCLSLKGFFNADSSNIALNKLLQLWAQSDYSSSELAGMLIGASYGCINEREQESTELVWSGPDANLLPARRTEQVLLDIINSAQESLFIVSFVLVNIPTIEAALDKAVSRGVNVKMLLESEDKEASDNFIGTIKRLSASMPNIEFYIWPRKNREGIQGGFARVHAKCAVADKARAFITSANLTSAALDKNIEMGVNIEGGNIPKNIFEQLSAMISSKEIVHYTPNAFASMSEPKSSDAIPLEEMPDDVKAGSSIQIEFDNLEAGFKDARRFIVCDKKNDRPKPGTLVIIKHEAQYLLGNYRWNKQQSTDSERVFYVVTINGFGLRKKIKINESDWESFKPIAMEEKN